MLCDDLEEWDGGVGGRIKKEGIRVQFVPCNKLYLYSLFLHNKCGNYYVVETNNIIK